MECKACFAKEECIASFATECKARLAKEAEYGVESFLVKEAANIFINAQRL